MAKIFLDDFRNPDANMKNYNVVRSYETCVQLLQLFENDATGKVVR